MVRLLREIVSGAKFNSFKQLVEHLEEVGKVLQDAGPKGESRLSVYSGSEREHRKLGYNSRGTLHPLNRAATPRRISELTLCILRAGRDQHDSSYRHADGRGVRYSVD